MALSPIKAASYAQLRSMKAQPAKYSANQLIVSTAGDTYLLSKVLTLTKEEIRETTLEFLAKDGINISLQEVVKNQSATLDNLVKNESVFKAIKGLSPNTSFETCPVLRSLMLFPAITRCGHSVSYAPLGRWLFGHQQCPVGFCEVKLDSSQYAPNKLLQQIYITTYIHRRDYIRQHELVRYYGKLNEETEELQTCLQATQTDFPELTELYEIKTKIDNTIKAEPYLNNLSIQQLDAGIEKYQYKKENNTTHRRRLNIGVGVTVAITLIAILTVALAFTTPIPIIITATAIMTIICGATILGDEFSSRTSFNPHTSILGMYIPKNTEKYDKKITRNQLLKRKDEVNQNIAHLSKIQRTQKELLLDYDRLKKPTKRVRSQPSAAGVFSKMKIPTTDVKTENKAKINFSP